jgi:uncharacterized protein YqeY
MSGETELTPADAKRQALRQTLSAAMKRRDADAVNALRSVLGAIDNAEAADLSAAPDAQPSVIAGAVVGLGAGEVARRQLSSDDVDAIIRGEIAARRTAAGEYERLGESTAATTLLAEAAALEPFV